MTNQMPVSGGTGEYLQLWTAQQASYVQLRIQGKTKKEAAAEVGVHWNTATKWELHNPNLRMAEAIAAGQALVGCVSDQEVVHAVHSQMERTIKSVTSMCANQAVLQYMLESELALKAMKCLEHEMTHASRSCDKIAAAKEILRVTNVQQTIERTMTVSESASKGLEQGKDMIESELLGVGLRQQVWETMRVENPG